MPSPDDLDTLITAGIDAGSSAIKVTVLRDREGSRADVLAARSERIRRRDPGGVAESVLAGALEAARVRREQLAYLATTGDGDAVAARTGHFYGMTAHARGGLFLDPGVRAVLDVGALYARAVLVNPRGRVLSHRMTSQCASGSGQFLENISRYLGVTLAEIGKLSLQGDQPEPCSSICAVLAETDVINLVSQGVSVPNILRGIHLSMAGRYIRLLISSGAQGRVLVTGGLAADEGLLAALRETAAAQETSLEIDAHADSVLAGALGAALWGAFRVRKLARRGTPLGA